MAPTRRPERAPGGGPRRMLLPALLVLLGLAAAIVLAFTVS
jgi:hypothetical protein